MPRCAPNTPILIFSNSVTSSVTKIPSEQHPRESSRGLNPLELKSSPAACTVARLLAFGKQVALRPAKLNQRFRFAAGGAIFAKGNPISRERKKLPCRFCARGFRRNPSKICRGWQRRGSELPLCLRCGAPRSPSFCRTREFLRCPHCRPSRNDACRPARRIPSGIR